MFIGSKYKHLIVKAQNGFQKKNMKSNDQQKTAIAS